MRIPVIAGNWKMNKTISEALDLVNDLKSRLTNVDDVTIIVCPTFLCIKSVADALGNSNIHVGAQNMFWETSGAYTAEVSGEMLLEAGAEYVIIGHSERRQYFGETNETVNKKVKKALALGLKPIVCVGEMLEDREAGNTEKVVDDHLTNGLAGVSADEMKNVIVAYEPVWAIGTGKTATPEQAQEVHAFIRNRIAELWNEETAEAVVIQYGGSMKPGNVKELLAQKDIDGGLIGGAALKADSFEELAKFNK
ncbi:MAG: triose-phosphate isomerase [Chlamydiae bacterium]|nr:MAG: triose-phosphate isomerase [Chlamydiota bacterium]